VHAAAIPTTTMMAATRAAADLAGCRTIDLAVHELLTAARPICTVRSPDGAVRPVLIWVSSEIGGRMLECLMASEPPGVLTSSTKTP